MFETGEYYLVMASAIAVVSKYHITNKESIINGGIHPVLTNARNLFPNKDLHYQNTMTIMT